MKNIEGINFIEKKSYKTPAAAKKEIKPGIYYIRQGEYKYFSHFNDASDAIEILKLLEKDKPVEISERKLGLTIGFQGLFNGTKFVKPVMLLFYHSRALNNNFGQPDSRSGAMGVWCGGATPLFADIGTKIEKSGAFEGVKDNILVQTVVSGGKFYVTGIKVGMIKPFCYLYPEIMIEKTDKVIGNIDNIQELPVYKNAACVVSLFMPNFPLGLNERFVKNPVFIENPRTLRHIHFNEVETKGGKTVVTGQFPAAVSAWGETPKQAEKRCYSNIKDLFIPNSFFRTDIGQAWFRGKSFLQKWDKI